MPGQVAAGARLREEHQLRAAGGAADAGGLRDLGRQGLPRHGLRATRKWEEVLDMETWTRIPLAVGPQEGRPHINQPLLGE